MAHLCAENSSLMAYHMPATSARSEAPLVAIAQQLVQQQQQKHLQNFQHQYHHQHPTHSPLQLNSGVPNPWVLPAYTPWQSRSEDPAALTGGIYQDVFGDSCPTSGGSYFTDPTDVLDLSSPTLVIPSMESHFHDSSFVFRDSCATEHHGMEMGGLKVEDCGSRGIYEEFQSEVAITENAAGHAFRSKKNEMNMVISTAEEMGELVGFPPSCTGLKLPTLQSRGLESSETTGRSDVCVGDVGDATSEWMDCLMSDLQSDEADGVASCFDSNPCESTESSELPGATAGRCYSCIPEDAWPDGFTALQEALCVRNGCSRDVSPTWTRDTTNEVLSSSPSYDILSVSPPELVSSSSHRSKHLEPRFVVQGHLPLQGMQRSDNMCGMPARREAKSISEARTWQNRGTSAGKEDLTPKLKPKAGYERAGFQASSAHGLQLLHLLLECAKAIDSERDRAENAIAQIRSLSSEQGDPIQRLAAYLSEALAKRLARGPGIVTPGCTPSQEECFDSGELTVAYKALNDACPYFKFAHLTANQAILESMETIEKVHIVDFGISQGVQWAALLQAFATRPMVRVRPRIRITGISPPSLGKDEERKEGLLATGRRLTEFAKLLDLEFEFHPIVSKMEEVDISMFRIEEGESVAVNFMLQLHHLLGESSELLHCVLRVVRSLSPKVVTLAEYDASLNAGAFQKRFMSALHFYGAIFDSLDAAMPRDCAERVKMERLFFAEKMDNMLGCEGEERKKRLEARNEWHTIMATAGFRFIPLSHYAVSQARLLLWYYSENYSLTEGQAQAYLSLGWQHRPLLTVSAWACDY